ncbi:translation initiation factor eIF-5A, putative [Eimeria mitis]|uniref:Translation initiation factor eIF-5A, putative n=1 Tax=Eimeria mitis TaxID=44415 RepID=U6K315_9EIME|nr:translation initiation factor eIF-5A, putative [Eimeria mitis]CDJ30163.1 translation initiation factor eIF-5A, putative [Eimeria mitis]
MEVPNVKRTEYQLIDVADDGFVSLLLENGDVKNDLTLPKDSDNNPDDVAQQIKSLFAEGKGIGAETAAAAAAGWRQQRTAAIWIGFIRKRGGGDRDREREREGEGSAAASEMQQQLILLLQQQQQQKQQQQQQQQQQV